MQTATGEDGDVFEHGLAAIAEARGLDGGHLDGAAQLVHDEGREGFAFHVFRDDEERLAGLRGLLEHGEQVLEGADLLLVDEDVGVVEDRLHATPHWSRSRARGSPCRTACLRRRRGVVSIDLASSTVMVPSLPTLSIASAMISPMVVSQLAETVATCAISVRSFTFLEMRAISATSASTALLMPRWSDVGLAPAVTFLRPSL